MTPKDAVYEVYSRMIQEFFDDLDALVYDGKLTDADLDVAIREDYPELEDDWTAWKAGT